MIDKLRHPHWVITTILGSAIFALGYDLFLIPCDINAGGVSGLSMLLAELIPFLSVGTIQTLLNIPLFLLGGIKVGKKFFWGSLLGVIVSSVFIDLFQALPIPQVDDLLGTVYGGAVCGFGIGMVFACGTSTGGSDILVRLVKLRYRNVSLGQIGMYIDLVVAALTGMVFGDVSKALYTGVTIFVTAQVMDLVIYRMDPSRVAIIITREYQTMVQRIGAQLHRGATFLHAEGTYRAQETKAILTVVKCKQLADLKDLVVEVDPTAFCIIQDTHQVLGTGFATHTKDAL